MAKAVDCKSTGMSSNLIMFSMVLWESGYPTVCKTVYTGSNPVGTSIVSKYSTYYFGV